MGSRPLRYTFVTQENTLDLTYIPLTDLMLPATSGWSVSVESVFISGIADVLSLSAGLALNVTTTIATPENITNGNADSFVIGAVPLNSITIVVSPRGSIIWQNPNTWGTRTKWVLKNPPVIQLLYANQQTTSSHGPEIYDWAQFTLAFYDERTGSDEII